MHFTLLTNNRSFTTVPLGRVTSDYIIQKDSKIDSRKQDESLTDLLVIDKT